VPVCSMTSSSPLKRTTPRALHRRAAAYGLDLSQRTRIAVVVPRLVVAPQRDQLTELLGDALDRVRAPHHVTTRGTGAAVVLPADADMSAVIDDLRTSGLQLACGLGRPHTGIADLRIGLRDAEVAVEHALGHSAAGVVRYEDVDLPSWLVLEASESAVRGKALELLAPLEARPELLTTLKSYLHHTMDVPATARHLHVHANSLRYRLNRIEQLLGRNLRDAGDLAAIHIALLVTAPDGWKHSTNVPCGIEYSSLHRPLSHPVLGRRLRIATQQMDA
jgi:sugar diacid utilization regulator